MIFNSCVVFYWHCVVLLIRLVSAAHVVIGVPSSTNELLGLSWSIQYYAFFDFPWNACFSSNCNFKKFWLLFFSACISHNIADLILRWGVCGFSSQELKLQDELMSGFLLSVHPSVQCFTFSSSPIWPQWLGDRAFVCN